MNYNINGSRPDANGRSRDSIAPDPVARYSRCAAGLTLCSPSHIPLVR